MTLDPTTVRLSNHFLLSDFMGCESVYTKGYKNLFVDGPDEAKLIEGMTLAEHVLEPLLLYSRLSIAYGYISPDLSREIVKYQSPDKPSYHRWDDGAACDVALHEALSVGEAPIYSAWKIDERYPVSRVITYSESEFICVASRAREIESGDHRRALYENRYMGTRKPLYIKYPDTPDGRIKQKRDCVLEHNWRGAGYPTYHAGGVRAYEHRRTGRFSVMSDFLYSTEAIQNGYVNAPSSRAYPRFKRAGEVYDDLLLETKARRMSIVRGYESPAWSNTRHVWSDGIYLVVVPPEDMDPEFVAETALGIDGVTIAKVGKNRRVAIRAEL